MAITTKIDVSKLDFNLALKRVLNDVQTDFIYAPHLSIVFHYAKDELCAEIVSQLTDGKFQPSLPISIEVPKLSGFCRPGSILEPSDRLVYQLLVDAIAPLAEKQINRARVFSSVLLSEDEAGLMFESPGVCYMNFRQQLAEYCTSGEFDYVLRSDVASYFDRLNQHVLVNSLREASCDEKIVDFLEKFLSALSQKNSFGIIQGVLPSDFLGNYFLCDIDARFEIDGHSYARYVDDIDTFFKTEQEARVHRMRLGSLLRASGLSLNESKTNILLVGDLLEEENEIDRLFEDAKDEVRDFDREDYYQSTSSWGLDFEASIEAEIREMEIETTATKVLFDRFDVNQKTRFKIDKFCLPIFSAAEDVHAMEYVLDTYIANPHSAQVFAKYLGDMLRLQPDLAVYVEALLKKESEMIYDYQLLWVCAALMSAKQLQADTIKWLSQVLFDGNRSEVLRAVCAISIGKFGDAAHRRILRTHYTKEASPYVKSAILYSTRYLDTAERKVLCRTWEGHSRTNALIAAAIQNIA